jgi:hypothetical protein
MKAYGGVSSNYTDWNQYFPHRSLYRWRYCDQLGRTDVMSQCWTGGTYTNPAKESCQNIRLRIENDILGGLISLWLYKENNKLRD